MGKIENLLGVRVMLRLLAVIERDLKKFRRNPVVLAMSVLMPIIYLVILGNSFQGKLQALPLIVLNQDSGPHSRSVMESLRAIEAGPKTFKVLTTKNQKEAIDGVRAGRYKAVLIIPSDYSKKVSLKSRPEVGLFLDNTDGISSEAIRNAVAGSLGSIKADYVSIREKADEIFLRDSNLYKQVDYFQSLVPGVVIMAIFLEETIHSKYLRPMSPKQCMSAVTISLVMILKTDPRGYCPCDTRFRKGCPLKES